MFKIQTASGAHSRHALPLACLGALVWATAYTPVYAQSTSPTTGATEVSAQERSQRQADSVYRWIKLHAEPPRKADTARIRPKQESPGVTSRKPEARPAELVPLQNVPEETASAQAETILQESPTGAGVATSAEAASPTAPETPVTDVEITLKAIAQPQPEFPRELRNTVTNGKVMLTFTVQPDGSVSEPLVLNTTHRKLSKPALDAVSQWRFEPIRMARVAQVEIEFAVQ